MIQEKIFPNIVTKIFERRQQQRQDEELRVSNEMSLVETVLSVTRNRKLMIQDQECHLPTFYKTENENKR